MHHVLDALARPVAVRLQDELGQLDRPLHADATVTEIPARAVEQMTRRRVVQVDVELVGEHELAVEARPGRPPAEVAGGGQSLSQQPHALAAAPGRERGTGGDRGPAAAGLDLLVARERLLEIRVAHVHVGEVVDRPGAHPTGRVLQRRSRCDRERESNQRLREPLLDPARLHGNPHSGPQKSLGATTRSRARGRPVRPPARRAERASRAVDRGDAGERERVEQRPSVDERAQQDAVQHHREQRASHGRASGTAAAQRAKERYGRAPREPSDRPVIERESEHDRSGDGCKHPAHASPVRQREMVRSMARESGAAAFAPATARGFAAPEEPLFRRFKLCGVWLTADSLRSRQRGLRRPRLLETSRPQKKRRLARGALVELDRVSTEL